MELGLQLSLHSTKFNQKVFLNNNVGASARASKDMCLFNKGRKD